MAVSFLRVKHNFRLIYPLWNMLQSFRLNSESKGECCAVWETSWQALIASQFQTQWKLSFPISNSEGWTNGIRYKRKQSAGINLETKSQAANKMIWLKKSSTAWIPMTRIGWEMWLNGGCGGRKFWKEVSSKSSARVWSLRPVSATLGFSGCFSCTWRLTRRNFTKTTSGTLKFSALNLSGGAGKTSTSCWRSSR